MRRYKRVYKSPNRTEEFCGGFLSIKSALHHSKKGFWYILQVYLVLIRVLSCCIFCPDVQSRQSYRWKAFVYVPLQATCLYRTLSPSPPARRRGFLLPRSHVIYPSSKVFRRRFNIHIFQLLEISKLSAPVFPMAS